MRNIKIYYTKLYIYNIYIITQFVCNRPQNIHYLEKIQNLNTRGDPVLDIYIPYFINNLYTLNMPFLHLCFFCASFFWKKWCLFCTHVFQVVNICMPFCIFLKIFQFFSKYPSIFEHFLHEGCI